MGFCEVLACEYDGYTMQQFAPFFAPFCVMYIYIYIYISTYLSRDECDLN